MFTRSLIASAVLISLAAPAFSQTEVPDSSSADSNYIEEITVTAQMREQSVMDVPVTMDVIGGEFLERTNIMELDEPNSRTSRELAFI